jgi:serine/threonine protein kinase
MATDSSDTRPDPPDSEADRPLEDALRRLDAFAARLDDDGPAGAPFAEAGPYRLLYELGRGGQGAVYAAEDLRLRRRVAVKVLTGLGTLDDAAAARFRREAEVLSRLDHPGLCAVYDAGVENGAPYLVLRLVEGETLAAKIARAKSRGAASGAPSCADVVGAEGAAPPDARTAVAAAVACVARAARALHSAHEKGVVHRDVKPGNLMVGPDGAPTVLDFGLARDLEADAPAVTRTGDVVGTPAYLAPEQLDPHGRADRRTDVWALGVTLYEALTTRRPFDAPTAAAVADAVRRFDPDDPRRLNPAVTKDLAVVVVAALSKEPARRYATALAFAEDLERVARGEPPLARPLGPFGRARRFAARRPAAAALLFSAVVALPALSALGALYWAGRPAVEEAGRRARADAAERLLEASVAALAYDEPAALARLREAAAADPASLETAAALALAEVAFGDAAAATRALDARPEIERALPAAAIVRRIAAAPASRRFTASAEGFDDGAASAFELFLAGFADLRAATAEGENAAGPRAARRFRAAVLRSPHARRLYHFAWCEAVFYADDRAQAREAADAVLAAYPREPLAKIFASKALTTWDTDRALALAEEAEAGGVERFVARSQRAYAQLFGDRFADALATTTDLLDAFGGGLPRACALHALAASHLGRCAEVRRATNLLRTAGRMDPPTEWIALEADARCRAMTGDVAGAVEIARRLAATAGDVRRLNSAVDVLKSAGLSEEAVGLARRMVERSGGSALAEYALSDALSYADDNEAALEPARRAARAAPQFAFIQAHLAYVAASTDRLDEAVAAARAAEAGVRFADVSWAMIGFAYLKAGLVPEARAALVRAAASPSPEWRSCCELSLCLAIVGEHDLAAAAAERGASLSPDRGTAFLQAVRCLRDAGRRTEARRRFLEAWARPEPDPRRSANFAALWGELEGDAAAESRPVAASRPAALTPAAGPVGARFLARDAVAAGRPAEALALLAPFAASEAWPDGFEAALATERARRAAGDLAGAATDFARAARLLGAAFEDERAGPAFVRAVVRSFALDAELAARRAEPAYAAAWAAFDALAAEAGR